MNTTMADGARERLVAQIGEDLFGQPGLTLMELAEKVKGIRSHPATTALGFPVVIDPTAAPGTFEIRQPSPAGQGTREPGAIAAILRSMSINYRNGHNWDHLDSEVCAQAAAALADRQPVGQEPAFYLSPSDWGHIRIPMTKHRDVRALRHGFGHGDINLVPFYSAPPAQAVDLGPLSDLVAEWSHLADQMQAVLPQGSHTLRGYADQLKARIAMIDSVAGREPNNKPNRLTDRADDADIQQVAATDSQAVRP